MFDSEVRRIAKHDKSMTIIAGTLLTIFVVSKMVGFETLSIGLTPFQFRFVTALLPFAMVFRKYGVIGISAGCPLAHLLAFGSLFNAGAAFLSAFIGSFSSYLIFTRYRSIIGLFVGTLVITATWVFIFGTYYSYSVDSPILSGLSVTFLSLWVGVNVIGFVLAEGIRRLSITKLEKE